MKISIIGGGLAATACAFMLRRAGFEPEVFEAGPALATGASGNRLGLYNPRFTAQQGPQSDYFSAAFFLALAVLSELHDKSIDWNPCGALHLITNESKAVRFPQTAQNWGWDKADMRLVSAQDATAIAGVEIEHEALYLPRAGYVSPANLCAALAAGTPVHSNRKILRPDEMDADIVILANGMGVKDFAPDMPLRAVRGQITESEQTTASTLLRVCLCYGGYITPASQGMHMIGSTFQRWLDHHDPMEQDDEDNLQKLHHAVPALKHILTVSGHRAGIRATTRDHMPVVGALAGRKNLFVSSGHGSHGIVSSLIAAQHLADIIAGKTPLLSAGAIAAISPSRFSSPAAR